MIRTRIHILLFFIIASGSLIKSPVYGQQTSVSSDSTKQSNEYIPSVKPTYEYSDRYGDPFSNRESHSPFMLENPSNMKLEIEMDTGMNYTIYEKVGALNYRPQSTMSFEQFQKYQDRKINKEYWQQRSAGVDGESAVSGRRLVPLIATSPMFDRIFGGSYVDIQPNGNLNLDFGGEWQRNESPTLTNTNQRTSRFDFDKQMSLNVVGKIGEKLAITANYDDNNTFDFQNNLKMEYTGYEEDIIRKIELGNVSMKLDNSLMTGGQSLFGIKTQLQFGKLSVTALASRKQSSTTSFTSQNGVQTSTDGSGDGSSILIQASEYDAYRHFFLGHFFRDNYEKWLDNVANNISGLVITRVEVYVVQQLNITTGLRSILGVTDLGEPLRVGNATGLNLVSPSTETPNDNEANAIYQTLIDPGVESMVRSQTEAADYLENTFQMTDGVDFEIRPSVRKLNADEYTINSNLGYITLNSRLSEGQILAVSYEYTYNGEVFQVGELSENYIERTDDELIVLKLLMPAQNTDTSLPVWDLGMKNIYTLNARNLQQEGFELRINYRDDANNYNAPNLNEGINTKNIPLIEVMGLDQLNINQDDQPDGNFDYFPGVTINESNGNIIFPVLEPFGTTLENAFADNEQSLKDQYVYQELYDMTQAQARQQSLKNKFFLMGTYSASSSSSGGSREIPLPGFNVSDVVLVAQGRVLIEGQDYRLSLYGVPTAIITNPTLLDTNIPIETQVETDDIFSFRSRWLTGTRLNYEFNENMNVGATLLHLSERTRGVTHFTLGNEPIKNTKYGFDVNYQEDSRLLTKIVDALPLISTKEKSSITFGGEFAQLIPGTSNQVSGEPTSYIEDFESTAKTFRLGTASEWKLGSVPSEFRAGQSDLEIGFNRAKLAWYQIDNTFYTDAPDNLEVNGLDVQADPNVRGLLPGTLLGLTADFGASTGGVYESVLNLAYYPEERGPYNYDLTNGDELADPGSNFASITRTLPNNANFQEENIEYFEFWLMDPFSDARIDPAREKDNGDMNGRILFHIGELSEDVLQDNIQAFENGLPEDGSQGDAVRDSDWGYMTDEPFLTSFFTNEESDRENQDVGLDGLKTSAGTGVDDEFEFFSRQDILGNLSGVEDVSGDDFVHFLDPILDGKGVLERYKDFNGMEGNSPVSGSLIGSLEQDNEDLNNDNVVSRENESYFEYDIPINPNTLQVGQQYVIDQTVVDSREGEDVTWYQIRIPIRDGTAVNSPDLLFSRFIRMTVAGWENPVVLRMTQFQMVGSDWWKEENDLSESGLGLTPEVGATEFDLSLVGVNTNGSADGDEIPYQVPPGIEQDANTTTGINILSDEQSLRLCVDDLEDGDARAAYKLWTTNGLNMLNYDRFKMFFHAESFELESISDNEVSAFVRLSLDRTDHYYEIEIPLVITPKGLDSYSERDIWPALNEIDLALKELYDVKTARNAADFDISRRFTLAPDSTDLSHTITVVGNPKLSNVQEVMIGIRNPSSDDNLPKSVCIWANELRLTGYDDNNGWAATADLNVRLADFAQITGSTQYSSVGFGTIEQTVSQRSLEETFEYEFSADVNLDKLIPAETGIRLPMNVGVSSSVTTPLYDPLEEDLELEDLLSDEFDNNEDREDYKDKVITKRSSRNINFMNVGKEKVKPDAKVRVYDIENFTFDYSYYEEEYSDVYTAEQTVKNYSGGLSYNYTSTLPSVEPFKEAKFLSSPYLQLIKDINFSPLPNTFSFRSTIDRRFEKTQLRNSDLTTVGIDPNFQKSFTFDRFYTLRWSIFKNLNMNYTATARAIIDEPEGDIDTEAKRDSIWTNVQRLGRIKNFNQNISVNYRPPLDKLPITDWISADYRLSLDYTWTGGNIDQVEEFGNISNNSRNQDLTGKFDLTKLYNKSKYLQKINKPQRRSSRPPKVDTTRTSTGANPFKGILRLLMAVRSVNFNYSVRESTALPGVLNNPYMLGMNSDFDQPGWGFILGSQDPSVRIRAGNEGWLVKNETFSGQFVQSRTEDLSMRASIEPFSDFKIQLDANRTNNAQYQEIYRYDSDSARHRSLTPTRSGSYSISFLPIATAFRGDTGENVSEVFEKFVENRAIIRSRKNDRASTGEHGINSQDVLLPAFIAAYTDRSASSIDLRPFPTTPMPNWRVDYTGLSKLPVIKELFSSFSLSHAYISSFSISSYSSSLKYSNAADLDLSNSILDYPEATEPGEDGSTLVPVYIISQVDVLERFAPLIGVNVRTKGMWTAKIDYSKERSIQFDLSNIQMTETKSNNVTFDIGVSKEKFKVPFKVRGRTVVVDNQVEFRFAFTLRDTETVQRKIEDGNTVTDGNLNYQYRPTLSYLVNEKLNLTMYYERSVNEPKITSSAFRQNSSFGVQVRFNFSQ